MSNATDFPESRIDDLNLRFRDGAPEELLRWAAETFGDRIALCSAFGPESMVLLHYLSTIAHRVKVFTLDTGRLPRETHELMQKCEELYGLSIRVYSPDPVALREMVESYGINLFYRSVPLRKLCCEIRKVRPLIKVLQGLSAWITGLRSSQADTRIAVRKIELDSAHNNIVKINPLAGWQENEVWDYIVGHGLPYNPLHDRGYRSIGCGCCTRPTNPGEDIRAGRWWWEQNGTKECGLHTRIVDASTIPGRKGGSTRIESDEQFQGANTIAGSPYRQRYDGKP
jgi:phosphoadenosine phosphosulfate reductase